MSLVDNLPHNSFHLVPIARIDTQDIYPEIGLDILQHLPLLLVRDERDGDPNASEAAGAPDTVEICLCIGNACDGAGSVKFGDVLVLTILESIRADRRAESGLAATYVVNDHGDGLDINSTS